VPRLFAWQWAAEALPWRKAPPECYVLIFAALVWLAGLAAGIPANWPTTGSLKFVSRHYFGPVALAAFYQLAFTLALGLRNARARRLDPFLMLKLLPFVVLATFLHFNFKAWMPFVNPSLYDEAYHRMDMAVLPLLEAFLAARRFIAEVLPINVNPGYHHLFVGMFFVSLTIHGLLDRPWQQRRLVMTVSLILLLGGIAYWIAPALGPFLYRESLNPMSAGAQRAMLRMWETMQATGTIPRGYFIAPLAAMPSLHIAHALCFTWFAWKSTKLLFALYVPVFLWLVIESVASGFHYLIDLPAGALLMWLCYRISVRLIPQPEESGRTGLWTTDHGQRTMGQLDHETARPLNHRTIGP
jgi:hypothetical protein